MGKGVITMFAMSLALLATTVSARGDEAQNWRNIYLDAVPVLDVRYRFEFVDQAGFPQNAEANTVRTRAGIETGRYYGVGLVADGEWNQVIGSERFNDTINGKTQFPVVADPEDLQINQLYVIADGTIPDTVLKLGRQRIIWDNARFVGNVGFRQNEQTFDAFRGSVLAIDNVMLEYVYFEEVHRIFGRDSPVGSLGLHSHGLRGQYTGFEAATITPFVLLLDYDAMSQAGLDSQTYGALVTGDQALDDDWGLFYLASLAYQEDYADNPASFDLWYVHVAPGLAYDGTRLTVGYEVLQGNGVNAFQTPLATLHKFNGLTDRFLMTPANGLRDLYVAAASPLPGDGLFSGLSVAGAYHQFWAENNGTHYGSEWDAGVFKTFDLDGSKMKLGAQYASYSADGFSVDTDKLWLTVQFQLAP